MERSIHMLPHNPSLEGLAYVAQDVVFSLAVPQGLKMQIMIPQNPGPKELYPCVVFVQGSAWTFPNVYYQMPQLCQLANRGYVVATLTHRNALEGHPFPACLQDVKTAIRFLRTHAESYHIDPNIIGIFGTSSGGNLALLTGMTMNDSIYRTEEYATMSDQVSFMVDCFGPTDLTALFKEDAPIDAGFFAIANGLAGGDFRERKDVFEAMSPLLLVEDKLYPPCLVIHGTADTVVPYEQSVEFYNKMQSFNQNIEMIGVTSGNHEGDFWSQALIEIIYDRIDSFVASIKAGD